MPLQIFAALHCIHCFALRALHALHCIHCIALRTLHALHCIHCIALRALHALRAYIVLHYVHYVHYVHTLYCITCIMCITCMHIYHTKLIGVFVCVVCAEHISYQTYWRICLCCMCRTYIIPNLLAYLFVLYVQNIYHTKLIGVFVCVVCAGHISYQTYWRICLCCMCRTYIIPNLLAYLFVLYVQNIYHTKLIGVFVCVVCAGHISYQTYWRICLCCMCRTYIIPNLLAYLFVLYVQNIYHTKLIGVFVCVVCAEHISYQTYWRICLCCMCRTYIIPNLLAYLFVLYVQDIYHTKLIGVFVCVVCAEHISYQTYWRICLCCMCRTYIIPNLLAYLFVLYVQNIYHTKLIGVFVCVVCAEHISYWQTYWRICLCCMCRTYIIPNLLAYLFVLYVQNIYHQTYWRICLCCMCRTYIIPNLLAYLFVLYVQNIYHTKLIGVFVCVVCAGHISYQTYWRICLCCMCRTYIIPYWRICLCCMCRTYIIPNLLAYLFVLYVQDIYHTKLIGVFVCVVCAGHISYQTYWRICLCCMCRTYIPNLLAYLFVLYVQDIYHTKLIGVFVCVVCAGHISYQTYWRICLCCMCRTYIIPNLLAYLFVLYVQNIYHTKLIGVFVCVVCAGHISYVPNLLAYLFVLYVQNIYHTKLIGVFVCVVCAEHISYQTYWRICLCCMCRTYIIPNLLAYLFVLYVQNIYHTKLIGVFVCVVCAGHISYQTYWRICLCCMCRTYIIPNLLAYLFVLYVQDIYHTKLIGVFVCVVCAGHISYQTYWRICLCCMCRTYIIPNLLAYLFVLYVQNIYHTKLIGVFVCVVCAGTYIIPNLLAYLFVLYVQNIYHTKLIGVFVCVVCAEHISYQTYWQYRYCDNPTPEFDGLPCVGEWNITEYCNENLCIGKVFFLCYTTKLYFWKFSLER